MCPCPCITCTVLTMPRRKFTACSIAALCFFLLFFNGLKFILIFSIDFEGSFHVDSNRSAVVSWLFIRYIVHMSCIISLRLFHRSGFNPATGLRVEESFRMLSSLGLMDYQVVCFQVFLGGLDVEETPGIEYQSIHTSTYKCFPLVS